MYTTRSMTTPQQTRTFRNVGLGTFNTGTCGNCCIFCIDTFFGCGNPEAYLLFVTTIATAGCVKNVSQV